MANRKYAFTIVLYPESTSYDCESVLNYISSNYTDFAYILHDKDLVPADIVDPESGEIKAHKGDLKKPHYHVIFKFQNNRSISAVAKELNLAEHDIEVIKSWKAQVRYLIHLDDEDKVRYVKSDIVSNTPLEKYLLTDKEEYKLFFDLVKYVDTENICNPYTLLYHVCKTPELYAVYRRNGSFLGRCIDYNRISRQKYLTEVSEHVARREIYSKEPINEQETFSL